MVLDVGKPFWAEQIAEMRKALGYKNQETFARDLGIKRSKWARIEAGYDNPREKLTYEQRLRLLRLLQITHEQYIQRTEERLFDRDVDPAAPKDGLVHSDVRWIPRMGKVNGGSIMDPFDYYPIKREFWRPGAQEYTVQGDSMDDGTEKAIKNGDSVIVDTNLKDLLDGRVYALRLPGAGLTLKQARKLPNGEWWLFSWNPDQVTYRPFIAEDAEIIGKVYKHIPAPKDL